MKYIRTEDGKIYKIVDDFGTWTSNLISREIVEKALSGNKWFKGLGLNTIAQADTIEELCDCIIVRNRSINKRFVYSKNAFRKRVERNKTNTWGRDNYEDRLKYLLEYNDVYAAIWTKGKDDEPILKSVAKMNEEGELELI